MPGYFTHVIERPTHSATLEASLASLEGGLAPDVFRHHAGVVRAEVARLTWALMQVAKGFPCSTAEDVRRLAREAVSEKHRQPRAEADQG